MTRNDDDLVLSRTAPKEVEGIVLRVDPMRGVVADYFPETTFMSDESLSTYRAHPGVVNVEGNGGVGSRVRLTCANGEALYELTYRASLPSGAKGYGAERRFAQAKITGTEHEAETFDHLQGFTDKWPLYAGFSAQFLRLLHVKRVGKLVTITADGVTGDYLLAMRHPYRRDTLLAERTRLVTPTGITLTLPTVSMRTAIVS